MRSLTDHSIVYYHCRRDVVRRCPSMPVREDVLVAWATALFERIEEVQPDAVDEAVASARSSRRSQTGSIEQVEASLQRLEKLFVWGHVDEAEYLVRRRDLDALRAELRTASETPSLPVPIAGVGQAWRLADDLRRRRLLNALFEKLYVCEGDVVRFVARREYRTEVEALVAMAVGGGLEYERPVTGRGANLTRKGRALRALQVSSSGGKGGVLFQDIGTGSLKT